MKTPLITLVALIALATITFAAKGMFAESGPPAPPGLIGITPAPTPTQVVASKASTVLVGDQVKSIAERIFKIRGVALPESIALLQGTVAGLSGASDLTQYSPDYPVWEVSATGSFERNRGPDAADTSSYRRITIWLDGITGDLVKLEMSDPASSSATPAGALP